MDLAAKARIRNGWIRFQEALPFLTSTVRPPVRYDRSSVCQLCQKQHELWEGD